MKKLLLSVMSLMAMNGAMAQTAVGDNDLANAYATQTITGRIAVHDPSIVMDVTGSPPTLNIISTVRIWAEPRLMLRATIRYGKPSKRVRRIPEPATVFLLA